MIISLGYISMKRTIRPTFCTFNTRCIWSNFDNCPLKVCTDCIPNQQCTRKAGSLILILSFTMELYPFYLPILRFKKYIYLGVFNVFYYQWIWTLFYRVCIDFFFFCELCVHVLWSFYLFWLLKFFLLISKHYMNFQNL